VVVAVVVVVESPVVVESMLPPAPVVVTSVPVVLEVVVALPPVPPRDASIVGQSSACGAKFVQLSNASGKIEKILDERTRRNARGGQGICQGTAVVLPPTARS
jgi:hypothetical protein